MIDNTINDDKTIAGGGKDVILEGRYHLVSQQEVAVEIRFDLISAVI